MAKPALGRGLGALLGGNPPAPAIPAASIAASDNRERVQRVPLNKIRPSALQPRKQFSGESLRELADSIREQGIVQPLIVRERDGFFELIAGERRWRAAQLLNLPEVPVIAREADDRAVLELALIENLQRENLNAIEEAHGYAQLAEQFQLTQEEIAAKVGKSRAAVANSLRLIKLPQTIQNFVRDGRLSVGHAKVILGLTDEKNLLLAAERVIKDGLNVRQTEGLVAKLQKRGGKGASSKEQEANILAAPIGDPHVADLTKLDDLTLGLLTNDAVIAVNQNSTDNHQIFQHDGLYAWMSDVPGSPDKYLAVFNARSRPDDAASSAVAVSVKLSESGFTRPINIKNLWTHQNLGPVVNEFAPAINDHGADLYRISRHPVTT